MLESRQFCSPVTLCLLVNTTLELVSGMKKNIPDYNQNNYKPAIRKERLLMLLP